MIKNKQEELILEAIQEWKDGKLNDRLAIYIVAQLTTPQREPSEKMIEYAKSLLKEDELNLFFKK